MVLAWHTLPSVRRQSRFLNNSPRRLFGEEVSRGEEGWGGGGGGGGGEGELGGQCVVWNAPGRPRCCQYIDILFWLKRASQGPLLHTNTNSPSRRFLLLRALTGRSTLEIVELHFIWAATASHSASSRPRLLINEYIGALKSRVSPTTTTTTTSLADCPCSLNWAQLGADDTNQMATRKRLAPRPGDPAGQVRFPRKLTPACADCGSVLY